MIVGSNWVVAMAQGMAYADRTIAILSSAYLRSVYGRREWKAAVVADPHGFARKLVPIRVEDCRQPGVLGQIVSFDIFDLDAQTARDHLLRQLAILRAGRAKPASPPRFPTGSRSIPSGAGVAAEAQDAIPVGGHGSHLVLEPLGALNGQVGAIDSLCFSLNDDRLVTGSRDNTALLWNLASADGPRPIASHKAPVAAVAFSSDDSLIATGSHDGTAAIWDAVSGELRPLAEIHAHRGAVSTVSFHPGKDILMTAGVGGAILWDIADVRRGSIRKLVAIGQYAVPIDAAAFSPDGRFLATGDSWNGGAGVVWGIETPERPAKLAVCQHERPVIAVAFHPDSQSFVTGSVDETAVLWAVGEPSRPMSKLTDHRGPVGATAFSPDGRLLVTGSTDETATIWDVSNQREPERLATLAEHRGAVVDAAFGPNSDLLGIATGLGSLWRIHRTVHPSQ